VAGFFLRGQSGGNRTRGGGNLAAFFVFARLLLDKIKRFLISFTCREWLCHAGFRRFLVFLLLFSICLSIYTLASKYKLPILLT
tara:strand:- start:676 stop:927 length:252 start_codon:yes stop_codon:yes gene_type:complete